MTETETTKPNLCHSYDQLRDEVARLNREREDLAMLVRRLAVILHRYHESNKVASGALDYLKRKGLSGSVLRETQQEADDGH